MGVRQLHKYMTTFVADGLVPISLVKALKAFKKKRKVLPILIFDFGALIKQFDIDLEEILCGGRLNKLIKGFEEFLQRLSEYAELVHFVDGIIIESKLSLWIKRHDENYNVTMQLMESVKSGGSLKDIAEDPDNYNGYPGTAITRKWSMMQVAKRYGKVFIAYSRECDSEMARYAYNNPRVFGIFTDDTDFLIFPGNWKSLTLRNLNFKTLETSEMSRAALRKQLNLDNYQLAILATLNGNDIIQFSDNANYHNTLGNRTQVMNPDYRFPILARKARELSKLPKDDMIDEIEKLFGRRMKLEIQESLEMFNPIFYIPQPTDYVDLHKFCIENHIELIEKLLLHATLAINISYVDLAEANIIDVKISMLKKQMGIIFANMPDKMEKAYQVVAKFGPNEGYRAEYIKPMPLEDVPPLLELLDRSKYREHDEIRFKLLKFMIGVMDLKKYNLSSFPTNYLQDILTLVLLRYHNFIEKFEADLILLTMKHVEEKTVPEDLKVPTTLSGKAFQTSFLFSRFHHYLDECFQVSGLSELTKLNNFDGVLFHNLHHEYLERPYKIYNMLGDVLPFRIYK